MIAVLAGNPNAGKTTLFNRLTKSNLSTGNWHGVTTRPAYKTIKGVTYADVPGMYSFDGYSMEEESAAREIKNADIVVNVVDSLTLESALRLTRRIIAMNKCTVVYVTKLKTLRRRGGSLDKKLLSSMLGVPVVSTVKELENLLKNGIQSVVIKDENIALNKAYYGGNCNLSKAEKVIYNAYTAPVIFVVAILIMFFLAFYPNMPGEVLKGLAENLICVNFKNFISANMTQSKFSSLVCDGIIGGAGGVLSFTPQLAVLYLFLILLDESGIMSALSFSTDGLFEKVNLSGRAVFSLISGFGCTAAAILTTRGLTTKQAQRRTVYSLGYIPCGAKLPVFLTFLSPVFANPFPVISAFYFAGLAISILAGKFTGGKGEELLSEVTPIGFPSLKHVAIKLCFYLKGFIIKVATAVMLFCIVSWFLSNFTFTLKPCSIEESMLAAVCKAILPIFYPMGVTDWRLAYALVTGFAAKENIAATISVLIPEGLTLNLAATLASSTFLLLCPACISAFSASCKEVGALTTLKVFCIQLIVAFLGAYAVHLIFII
ncbi:MAG: ferrous iron transporter B [Clostridia bacterium]|nr:ferrous iron transporter B [Clostridia bacterium]